MKPTAPQSVYAHEEDRHAARIVSTLILISWGVYFFVILSALYLNDLRLIAVTLAGCALQIIPFSLVKRHLQISSLLVVLNAFGTVTLISIVGQGIRDLALIAFPIIFIFAGLTLTRAFFRISVGAAWVLVSWLAIGEAMGWFIPQPLIGEMSNWIYLLMVTLLFVIAAIAVDLLATNIRSNLERAHQEIAQRKLTEKALQESEERFKLSMDATNDGLWDLNVKTGKAYFSPGYYRMLGLEAGESPMENGSWDYLIHPDDREIVQQVIKDCIEGHYDQFEIEYRVKTEDGEWRWVLDRGKSIERDEQGQSRRMLGTNMDITARKQAEEKLRYQGSHDALTGLYNRSFFQEELERFERSRIFPTSIVVADLDKLKIKNDTQGHHAGDELLKQAAIILQSVFRAEDVLARIGGDEFAALLPATDSETAGNITTRIRERLAEHNRLFPDSPVELSLGHATSETNNLSKAFSIADQLMYAEKAFHKQSKKS